MTDFVMAAMTALQTSPHSQKYNLSESRTLGAGSFGAVFSATATRDFAPVAIKAISLRANSLSLLSQELACLGFLTNDCPRGVVCPLREAFATPEGGPSGGFLFVVMNEGVQLAPQVKRLSHNFATSFEGPAIEALNRILVQAYDAIKEVHVRGIIHRDIKIDNFLMDAETNSVVLADFGLSKRLGSEVDTSIAGTPAYISPEMWSEPKEVTEKTDLWSLGIMALQALTGELPPQLKALRMGNTHSSRDAIFAIVTLIGMPAPAFLYSLPRGGHLYRFLRFAGDKLQGKVGTFPDPLIDHLDGAGVPKVLQHWVTQLLSWDPVSRVIAQRDRLSAWHTGNKYTWEPNGPISEKDFEEICRVVSWRTPSQSIPLIPRTAMCPTAAEVAGCVDDRLSIHPQATQCQDPIGTRPRPPQLEPIAPVPVAPGPPSPECESLIGMTPPAVHHSAHCGISPVSSGTPPNAPFCPIIGFPNNNHDEGVIHNTEPGLLLDYNAIMASPPVEAATPPPLMDLLMLDQEPLLEPFTALEPESPKGQAGLRGLNPDGYQDPIVLRPGQGRQADLNAPWGPICAPIASDPLAPAAPLAPIGAERAQGPNAVPNLLGLGAAPSPNNHELKGQADREVPDLTRPLPRQMDNKAWEAYWLLRLNVDTA